MYNMQAESVSMVTVTYFFFGLIGVKSVALAEARLYLASRTPIGELYRICRRHCTMSLDFSISGHAYFFRLGWR